MSKFFNKKDLGDDGERFAERFLKNQKKYKILAKNFRYKHGEVDIIAFDDPVTVFVEVRTRQKNALVSGYFSVSFKKKCALKPVCLHYIKENNLKFFRFDIVEILYDDKNFEAFHYENVPFF